MTRTTVGKIAVTGIKVECILGCNLEERQAEQLIALDLELELNFGDYIEQQKPPGALDWKLIVDHCSAMLISNRYYLAETAVSELAASLLREPSILQAKIRLTKSETSLRSGVPSVELTLRR